MAIIFWFHYSFYFTITNVFKNRNHDLQSWHKILHTCVDFHSANVKDILQVKVSLPGFYPQSNNAFDVPTSKATGTRWHLYISATENGQFRVRA